MKIFFYETKLGNSPIKKFIEKLSKSEQARFIDIYREITEFGFLAARVTFKPLEGKLWEIKFTGSRSSYRILYVLIDKERMVWLHVFIKTTQKTPLKELELARRRLKEVLK